MNQNHINNNKKVTLIIVTSPIQSHPDSRIIDEAIQSVLQMNYPFYEIKTILYISSINVLTILLLRIITINN